MTMENILEYEDFLNEFGSSAAKIGLAGIESTLWATMGIMLAALLTKAMDMRQRSNDLKAEREEERKASRVKKLDRDIELLGKDKKTLEKELKAQKKEVKKREILLRREKDKERKVIMKERIEEFKITIASIEDTLAEMED